LNRETYREIEQALAAAKVAVLLVSADFLASEFITTNELPSFLAAAKAEGTLILPVIVSPCFFLHTKELQQFQAVNSPNRPLLRMKKAEQEEVFLRVAERIFKTIPVQVDSALSDQILAIEAKDGTVWFGKEKYRGSGCFTVECNFYVLVGIEPVTLLGFTGLYYAYGCPSMSLPRTKLIIDHKEVSLTLDDELRPQCELPANRRSTISYFCSFRPPLRCTQPADCDNGDIMVSISWRMASQLKTHVTNVIFRFTDTGIRQMEKADSLRQPPRVTDAELQAWYTEGKLTEQALEDLCRIDPVTRYMDAFNDNTTSWRISETGFHYTSLLRELVGNPHKPEL
jgi:hypothetical protein